MTPAKQALYAGPDAGTSGDDDPVAGAGSEGLRSLAIADLRDDIGIEKEVVRSLWARVLLGGAATALTLFYVAVGVGNPAILLAVASGLFTGRAVMGYRRRARRLREIEERLAALLEPMEVADVQDEIELERGEVARTLWRRVLLGGVATSFCLSFLTAGVGALAAILASLFGLLTLRGVVDYFRSDERLRQLEGRLATLLEPEGSSGGSDGATAHPGLEAP